MKTRHLVGAAQAAILAVVASTSASAANVTYSAGDLIIGFQSSNPADTNIVLFNAGSAAALRDNPNGFASVNISSLLSTAFGSDWNTAGDVSWGIAANFSTTIPDGSNTVNGDPSRTFYASKASTNIGFGVGDSVIARPGVGTAFSATQLGTITNNMDSSFGFNGAVDSGGSLSSGTFKFQAAAVGFPNAAIFDKSGGNSWATLNNGATSFGSLGNIQGTINGGFSYLDLYRVVSTNTGASPAGTVGKGDFVTTFYIDANGLLSAANSASPIPEPSTYAVIAAVAALGAVVYRRRNQKA